MPAYVQSVLERLVSYTNHMGPRQWGVLLVLIVVVGFACMRGFGSRSSY
jgi:hypothetical protein